MSIYSQTIFVRIFKPYEYRKMKGAVSAPQNDEEG